MHTQNAAVSRRSLVKGAALGAAGLAAAGALAPAAHAAEGAEPAWAQEADVVVVGLGAGGVTAAVAALEGGASVCVIESNARGGGSTVVSGGLLYMGGTQLQKDLGIEDSVENLYAYVSKAAGPRADPDLVKLFCDSSPDLYDWLVEHGVQFEGEADTEGHTVIAPAGVCLNYSGNERNGEYAAVATPAPRGHTPVGGGMGMFEPLEKIVDEQATVLYETTGTSLVTDESGAVIGVIAQDKDGAEVAVKANKGVVLSCGAFTFDDALLENVDPIALQAASRTGVPNDTGSGIKMGMRIGAAVKSMAIINLQLFIYRYGDMPCGIIVDSRGARFMSESSYGTWIGRGVEKRTPEACWVILDDEIGGAIDDALGGPAYEPVFQADTLEELAEMIGAKASTLTASVERYNALVEAGEDVDYGKESEYLRPIATAPFYAYDCSATKLGFHTLGGLKINTNAEVIDLDGNVIPGLYAAGRTSCGIFGEYPGSGSSIADGMTFGRVAGTSAAAR